VGQAGEGLFIQANGTTLWSSVSLGAENTGSGTYRLEEGRLETIQLHVGVDGRGAFVQTGGVHIQQSTYHPIRLASAPGSEGSYHLTGDGELHAGTVEVGFRGVGTFEQTGGSQTLSRLEIGVEEGSRGSFEMSGGELETDHTTVGLEGEGSFHMRGGHARLGGGRHR